MTQATTTQTKPSTEQPKDQGSSCSTDKMKTEKGSCGTNTSKGSCGS